MHATAHRDTDRRGKKLADLHSDIEHVHKTASSGGDISCLLQWKTCFSWGLLKFFGDDGCPGMPGSNFRFPPCSMRRFWSLPKSFLMAQAANKAAVYSVYIFFLRTYCGNCAGRITSVSPTCWFWNRPVVLFHVRCRVPRIVPMSSPINTSYPGSTSLPLGQLSPCLRNPAFIL